MQEQRKDVSVMSPARVLLSVGQEQSQGLKKGEKQFQASIYGSRETGIQLYSTLTMHKHQELSAAQCRNPADEEKALALCISLEQSSLQGYLYQPVSPSWLPSVTHRAGLGDSSRCRGVSGACPQGGAGRGAGGSGSGRRGCGCGSAPGPRPGIACCCAAPRW